MAINYERCVDVRPEINQMAREVLEKYHTDLRCPDGEFVRIAIFLVFQGDGSDEPAVTAHGGWPAYAKIGVIPLKQRVDKRADVEIIIDKDKWDNALTEPQQMALLDHEIEHIEFQKDDVGAIKTDDIGRPKIKLKLEDYRLSGFRSVARRHGEHALEVIGAAQWHKDFAADVLPQVKAVEPEKLFA